MLSNNPVASLIVAGDFRSNGGMDRANLALATHLIGAGSAVSLVAHSVEVSLATACKAVELVPKPLGSYFLGGPLLSMAGRSKSLSYEPRRVVVNGGNCPIQAINWVHYVHSVPWHGDETNWVRFGQRELYSTLNRLSEKRALRKAAHIIANSHRTKSDLVQFAGVPRDLITVVHYGICRREFAPLEQIQIESVKKRERFGEGPTVVFVGALGDSRKGFDIVIRSWIELSKSPSWDAELIVLGRGRSLGHWKELARGTSARIKFLGFRQDVAEIVGSSDLLVAPSRYEAFGLVGLEALAMGIPILVTSNCGVSEVLPYDASNFLLPERCSASDLVSHFKMWRRDLDLFKATAMRISPLVRRRSWDDMAVEIDDIMRLQS